jgi:uncharacterized membrane protein
VDTLKAGGTPDPEYGRIAKLRSTHNNYLTLPVLFLMLSNHYPLAFGTEYNWIIASLVFLMGVTIRHYFNTTHARAGNPTWTWLATAVIFVLIVWLSTATRPEQEVEAAQLSAHETRFVEAAGFAEAQTAVLGRCSMCHASEVFWPGLTGAPKGVVLETDAQIAAHAREIYLQAGRSHAMPPGNVTGISQAERAAIVRWYEAAVAPQG